MLLFVFLVFKSFSISVILALLGMSVLLVFTSAISAAESAFFSLGPAELDALKTTETRTDKRILDLIEKPKRLLATLLISLNFVNIAIVILSSFVMSELFDFAGNPTMRFVIQVISVTFLILIIGEIVPKIYSIQHPLPVTRILAFPVKFCVQLFYPLSSFLMFSTSLIDKRIHKKAHSLTVEQLSQALELTSEEKVPHEDKKLLQGIVKFGDTDVKQIMHSRVNVIAFDFNTPYPDLVRKIEESVFSRIPVYRESFDNIVGVLYIKDILPHFEKKEFDWHTLLRETYFIPESKKIDDLLREFQHNKIHLAVVVDEYGGTSGIVTLEDIIEEIIGEINDEFDDEEIVYSKLDTRNYVFEGKVNLKDLYRILNLDDALFEEKKGESDSLAGFLIELEGRILKKGEKVSFNGILFTIESADNRKIKRVKITLPE